MVVQLLGQLMLWIHQLDLCSQSLSNPGSWTSEVRHRFCGSMCRSSPRSGIRPCGLVVVSHCLQQLSLFVEYGLYQPSSSSSAVTGNRIYSWNIDLPKTWMTYILDHQPTKIWSNFLLRVHFGVPDIDSPSETTKCRPYLRHHGSFESFHMQSTSTQRSSPTIAVFVIQQR